MFNVSGYCMLKYVAPIIFVIILVGFMGIFLLKGPKYKRWGFEKRLLPASASDIHELKRSRYDWGLYLLKAKVTQDDFDKFVKDITAVKYEKTDFILVWRYQANYPIPEWWDPTNDVNSTFYDPSVKKTSEIRITKYENGYLYLHYECW
jgi:hypothetical protein